MVKVASAEEATAADGEVLEEANDRWEVVRPYPLLPQTPTVVFGGSMAISPPRNHGGVKKHRCLHLPRRVTGTEGLGDE